MTSLKKTYARQLLQLAITLSLLRVDPDSYFGFGWESQLALQDGDGWQLQLQAAPITDYPYSNRKAVIPLIEDLVRFDRHVNPTPYDVQTYLLNVQNEAISSASMTSTASIVTSNENETTAEVNSNSRIANEISESVSAMNDLFLINADPNEESASVLEQNLADLSQYEDLTASSTIESLANINHIYAGLPMKDELPDFDLNFRHTNDDETATGAASIDSLSAMSPMSRDEHNGLLRNAESPVNFTHVIEWSRFFNDSDVFDAPTVTVNEDKAVSVNRTRNSTRTSESDSGEDERTSTSASDDSKFSTSGFSSNAELTEEVRPNENQIENKKCTGARVTERDNELSISNEHKIRLRNLFLRFWQTTTT